MELKQLKKQLKEYMAIPRVSGYEKEMAYRLKEDFEKYCSDVRIDKIGNVIAAFEGSKKGAPTLMVFAHLDTIGFVIKRIDKDGFIYVDRDDDGSGSNKRYRKDSFYWFQKVTETNNSVE